MSFSPLGDTAVVASLGSVVDAPALARVRALTALLKKNPPAGLVEIVPAFASVTVFYDLARGGSYAEFCAALEERLARVGAATPGQGTGEADEARVVEIPVCYGGELGPDLGDVAARAGVSLNEVVALHAGADYLVHAIGFAPGFAYLGGLPEKIHAPRRATPRTAVPAGTVGIGGAQTGVYPHATPGGWNLIGRTPLRLFDAGRDEPALLRAGDRVRFRAIGAEEFAAWR